MKGLLTPDAARALRLSPVGEGWLCLKVSPTSLYTVRVVYQDGILVRAEDGQPVFPLALTPADEATAIRL